MLTTNDDVVADTLRVLRNEGMHERYQYVRAGHNYRLTDVQAAIALPQLATLAAGNALRQANQELKKTRVEEEDLKKIQAQVEELGRLRKENEELHRLRNEVHACVPAAQLITVVASSTARRCAYPHVVRIPTSVTAASYLGK